MAATPQVYLPSGAPDLDPSSVVSGTPTATTETIGSVTYDMVDIDLQNPGIRADPSTGATWNLGALRDWAGDDVAPYLDIAHELLWYSLRPGATIWPDQTWAGIYVMDAATLAAATRVNGYALKSYGTGYRELTHWYNGVTWASVTGATTDATTLMAVGREAPAGTATGFVTRRDNIMLDIGGSVREHTASGTGIPNNLMTHVLFACGWQTGTGPATGTIRVRGALLGRTITGMLADGM